VAGDASLHRAYIISATDVMHDIRTRLGHDVTLPKIPTAITNRKAFPPKVEEANAVEDFVRTASVRSQNTGHCEGSPSKYFAKDWFPIFSKDRNFKQEGSWKDGYGDGDDFGIFPDDCDGAEPSFKLQEIEGFCRGASLDDLQSGAGLAGQRRAAWLDDRGRDREISRLGYRKYERPLTATELYRHLEAPVGIFY